MPDSTSSEAGESGNDNSLSQSGENQDQLRSDLPHVERVKPIRDEDDEPYVFRFEVGPAILQQLLVKLESLVHHPLDDALAAGHPGFYQLFLDGSPVYIGKTSRSIGERMREHKKKIRGRVTFDRITCKYAYVEDPSLVDVSENALIGFFDELNAAEWNHSGFGSKVTGYGRAGQKISVWADQFPPDLSWLVEAGSDDSKTLGQIIWQLTRKAPITFSLPRKYKKSFDEDHPEVFDRPPTVKPFIVWARWVSMKLKPGWHIEKTRTGWYVAKGE